MLDTMRNAAKGWTAKILIGLLALSFGIWGIADVFTGSRATALATVGGRQISQPEFERAYRDAMRTVSQQTGQNVTPELARAMGLDEQVLNGLVMRAALDTEAARLGLAVSARDIAEEVAANPAYQNSQGKFDVQRLRNALQQDGLGEAEFFALERERRIRQAIAGAADADFAAPATLVEAMSQHQNEQRDARYFVARTDMKDVPPPSDANIKAHYDKYPASYTAPEYRSLAIIKAEPADVAARVPVTEDEAKAAYEKFKLEYFTPERRVIQQMVFASLDEAKAAKEKLGTGTDLVALAREKGLTEADITLGTLARKDIIDPVIAEAAFALAEGAVSDPVQGRLSVALLKAVSIAREHQQSFDEAKTAVTVRLQLDKAHGELNTIYAAVEDARAAQTKFEAIAAKANVPFLLAGPVDAGGLGRDGKPLPPMPMQTEMLKRAFESEPGVETDALQTAAGGFIWYELREVVPSQVRPLDKVRDQVKADLAAERLRALSLERAGKLVDRLKGGAKLEDLAKESGAEVKTVLGLKRNESSAEFDTVSVSALFGVPEDGFTSAPEGDGASVKIIQPQAVLLPGFDAKSAETKSLATAASGTAARDLLRQFEGAVRANAGVKVDEALWRQVTGLPAN